jgi:hypothetical protein
MRSRGSCCIEPVCIHSSTFACSVKIAWLTSGVTHPVRASAAFGRPRGFRCMMTDFSQSGARRSRSIFAEEPPHDEARSLNPCVDLALRDHVGSPERPPRQAKWIRIMPGTHEEPPSEVAVLQCACLVITLVSATRIWRMVRVSASSCLLQQISQKSVTSVHFRLDELSTTLRLPATTRNPFRPLQRLIRPLKGDRKLGHFVSHSRRQKRSSARI